MTFDLEKFDLGLTLVPRPLEGAWQVEVCWPGWGLVFYKQYVAVKGNKKYESIMKL